MKLKNNHDMDLRLPGGQLAPKGKTITVENWNHLKNNAVMKSWLAAKIFTASKDAADKVEDDGRDVNKNPADPNTTPPQPAKSEQELADIEAAQKAHYIEQLATHGIKRTTRTSLDNLKAALREAEDKAADDDDKLDLD